MVAPDPRVSQAAELYIALFAGRDDAYSVWTGDHWQLAETHPRPPAVPERFPLTPDVVVRAFQTRVPVSAYMLGADSLTGIACLDIDRAYGLRLGKAAMRTLRERGAVGYLEPSNRGAHLWVPLPERMPGVWARRMLRGLIAAARMPPCPGSKEPPVRDGRQRLVCAGCPMQVDEGTKTVAEHDDPKIELRPAQDRLSSHDSVGICLRMPTMPHHRTGQRYRMIGPYGELLPEKLADMMAEVETGPLEPLQQLAEEAPPPRLPKSAPLPLAFPLGVPSGSQESASEILRTLWGMPEPKVGKANRCPAHDDHSPSLSIAPDDQRVWCKTGTCVLSNGGRGRGTHELIALAPKR